MDPRLIEYNRKRKHQTVRRHLYLFTHVTIDDLMRGGQNTDSPKRLGVHRSTICRDMKVWWAFVRRRQREKQG